MSLLNYTVCQNTHYATILANKLMTTVQHYSIRQIVTVPNWVVGQSFVNHTVAYVDVWQAFPTVFDWCLVCRLPQFPSLDRFEYYVGIIAIVFIELASVANGIWRVPCV